MLKPCILREAEVNPATAVPLAGPEDRNAGNGDGYDRAYVYPGSLKIKRTRARRGALLKILTGIYSHFYRAPINSRRTASE